LPAGRELRALVALWLNSIFVKNCFLLFKKHDMPHFIIECSENIIKLKTPEEIIQAVYNIAEVTNLFAVGDIKARIKSYAEFTVGGTKSDFIHVFGHIMQGRNTEQKVNLSKQIISKLKSMFPDVPVISMNVIDFEKATYCNKTMV
jgi:5-carboxymethyl-2-hydroxymuconate isomerase